MTHHSAAATATPSATLQWRLALLAIASALAVLFFSQTIVSASDSSATLAPDASWRAPASPVTRASTMVAAPPLLSAGVEATAAAAQHSAAAADAGSSVTGATGDDAARPRRFALGVRLQSGASSSWVALMHALAPSDARDVSLFLSVWGGTALNASAAAAFPPGVVANVAYEPNATYTSGRNLLMASMHAAEVARGAQFEWWVFLDADALSTDCARCESTRPPDWAGPACCAGALLGVLRGNRHGLAQIGVTAHANQESAVSDDEFILRDCTDHKIFAVARAAAPVLLPYHLDGEADSWWRPQFLLWWYLRGCVRGYVGVLGRSFNVFAEVAGAYPRGDPYGSPWTDLDSHHAGLMSRLNVSHAETSPCDPVVAQLTRVDGPVRGVSFESTGAFHECAAAKEAVFRDVIGRGAAPAPRYVWP